MHETEELKPRTKLQFKALRKVVPTQANGSDCGVFVCKFAEMFYLRELKSKDLNSKDFSTSKIDRLREIIAEFLADAFS